MFCQMFGRSNSVYMSHACTAPDSHSHNYIYCMYTCVMSHACADTLTFRFRNVGSLIAAITALVSAIVMIQTRHDTLYARSVSSDVLEPLNNRHVFDLEERVSICHTVLHT